MKNEQMSFQLILHAGNAKSLAMEAMSAAQKNDFKISDRKISEASEELTIAHKAQYDLLAKYSNGEQIDVDILMVHAQDHISGAALIIEMAKEIVALNKRICNIEKEDKGNENFIGM